MGCLVVEMATREVPWHGLQMQQIMYAVTVEKKIPNVPEIVPEFELIRRCFEYDPSARPSAAELAAAFEPDISVNAPVPEILGVMTESFSRKIAQLSLEREETQKELAVALEKLSTTQQSLEVAQKEIERLHNLITDKPATPPGKVGVSVPGSPKRRFRSRGSSSPSRSQRSRKPTVTVFEVLNCEVVEANGPYFEDGSFEGKPRYKNANGIRIYGRLVGPWNRPGFWGLSVSRLHHPDVSSDFPPPDGWLKSDDGTSSSMRLIYVDENGDAI